jgi:hypothetical protein
MTPGTYFGDFSEENARFSGMKDVELFKLVHP